MVDNARGAVGQPASHETPSDMVMGERVTIEEVLYHIGQILSDDRYPPALKLWTIRECVKGFDDEKIKRLLKVDAP